MKKILSYIIVAAMMFTIMPYQYASAAGEIIDFKASESVAADGSAQVKLNVKLKNISFNTLQFTLKYDTSRLEVSDFQTNQPTTELRDAIENIAPVYSAAKEEGWQFVTGRKLNTNQGTMEYATSAEPRSIGKKDGADNEGFINANSTTGLDLMNISFRIKDGKKLTDKSIQVLDSTMAGYNPGNPTGVLAYTKTGDATNFIKNMDLTAVATEAEPDTGVVDPSKPVKPGDFTDSGVIEEDKPPVVVDEIAFKDIQNHWAKNDILRLAKKGIIKGYEGGLFKPENNLTRAEFSVIMARILDLKEDIIYSNFTDTKGHWAEKSIEAVKKAELMLGDAGKFRPNDYISRQEIVTIIGRAKAFTKPVKTALFADDAKIAEWAKDYVYAAKEKNIINGYPDNTVRPDNKVTRAEMAKMINAIVVD